MPLARSPGGWSRAGGPGTIPPGSAAPQAGAGQRQRVEIKHVHLSRRRHGLVVGLETNEGRLSNLVVELWHGKHRLARAHAAKLTTHPVDVVLRVHRAEPRPGRYEVVVRQRRQVLAKRAVKVA